MLAMSFGKSLPLSHPQMIVVKAQALRRHPGPLVPLLEASPRRKKAPHRAGLCLACYRYYPAEATFLPPAGLILSVKFGHTSLVKSSMLRINAACGMWL